MGEHDGHHAGLWHSRYGSTRPTYLTRRPPPAPKPKPPLISPTGWTASAGRAWRRMSNKAQWTVTLLTFAGLQTYTPPAGVVFLVVLVIFLAITSPDQPQPPAEPPQHPAELLALAASGTLEAQVAGAAARAWDETRSEPAWASAHLTPIRASFDGDREVDAIIDVALRIHDARSN